MSSFGRQFSSGSPVLTMSPRPAHHSPFGAVNLAHPQFATQSSLNNLRASDPAPFTRPSISGRKRSRDEAAVNLDPPAKPVDREEEWILGPGMILIKADSKYVADACSQSGTWLEEKHAVAAEKRNKEDAEQREPRSHKLLRVAQPAVPASATAMSTSSPTSSTLTGQNGSEAPVVDDFTLHLGIGWRKISTDEHIQAAARGWARYIENHFPVTNAHVRLESKGLQSYLIEASEGFFLFAENLRRGQFVSATVQGALKNLGTSPPSFDDSNVLCAAESPSLSPVASGEDADMKLD
jgi:hypothetical protein